MAVISRSGADGSGVALVPQTTYGTHITANPTGRKFFPLSNLDAGMDPDIEESDLITSIGADVPDDIGQIGANLSFRTRVLVQTFGSILRGVLTTQTTSEKLADVAIDAADINNTNASNKVPATDKRWLATNAAVTDPAIAAGALGTLPGKIEIGGITSTGGTITVSGYVGIGRTGRDQLFITETITVASGDTTATSTKYWREVTNITLGTGVTGATITLTFKDQGYITEFTFGNQFPGWTVLGQTGGVPFLAYDYVPSQLDFNANSTRIELNISGLVSRIYERRTIAGGANDEKLALETTDTTAFPDADTRYYAGWGGTVLFGGEIVKYTDLTTTVNFNYENESGVDGSRFKTGVEATRNRQVTFTPTVRFVSGTAATDVFQKWDEIFLQGLSEPLENRMYAFSSAGQQSRITFLSPASQLNQAPRLVVGGPGPIDRSLSFKALPSGSADELKIQVISPDAWVAK